MGAIFLHGAAVTIHKSQGSQWEQVQVIANDLAVAANTGRIESGQPLWKSFNLRCNHKGTTSTSLGDKKPSIKATNCTRHH